MQTMDTAKGIANSHQTTLCPKNRMHTTAAIIGTIKANQIIITLDRRIR
jgi:hypothetical protein